MKKVMSVAVAGVLFGTTGASAHVPESEWRDFKAQYAALAERVNALEAENQRLREIGAGQFVTVEDLSATNDKIAVLEKQNKSTSWAESIKWKGDFRYRYEDIEEDGRDDRDRADPTYRQAIQVVLGAGKGSVSLIQRKLQIGYSRAARLLDLMAEDGLVGPSRGSKPRDVTTTLEDWEERQRD